MYTFVSLSDAYLFTVVHIFFLSKFCKSFFTNVIFFCQKVGLFELNQEKAKQSNFYPMYSAHIRDFL